mmetsp:Transcript_8719/g.32187  ORF Transcript_8719/g.32187 Transcript_8719/m.32187 type:complete len:211 (-) Transcript_8719:3080-3712(-)
MKSVQSHLGGRLSDSLSGHNANCLTRHKYTAHVLQMFENLECLRFAFGFLSNDKLIRILSNKCLDLLIELGHYTTFQLISVHIIAKIRGKVTFGLFQYLFCWHLFVCRQPQSASKFVEEGFWVESKKFQIVIRQFARIASISTVHKLNHCTVPISHSVIVGNGNVLHGLHQTSLQISRICCLQSSIVQTFTSSHTMEKEFLWLETSKKTP